MAGKTPIKIRSIVVRSSDSEARMVAPWSFEATAWYDQAPKRTHRAHGFRTADDAAEASAAWAKHMHLTPVFEN